MNTGASRPEVVDQRETPHGTLVLRRVDGPDGSEFEIISDGMFLMDTRNGESERVLVSAALAAADEPRRVLIGGLGVGFSLLEALAHPRVEKVVVVELHPVVVDWNRHFLGTPVDDPRTQVLEADITAWLTTDGEADADRFDAVCLDVDNGPDWLTLPSNAALYELSAVDRLAERLTVGGVLAFWSAAAAPELETRLRERFRRVWTRQIPVPRGEPDVVVFARDPFTPPRSPGADG